VANIVFAVSRKSHPRTFPLDVANTMFAGSWKSLA